MDTFDLQRMFIGELTWAFAFEIVLRTIILYIFTFGMVRWMAKRTTQQLTPFEFLMVIALGSSVGDPMFYPEVPLLAGLVVISVVVALEKLVSYAGQRSASAERVIEGVPHTVVMDGRLDLAGMDAEELAREELFGELRREGIEQLGQVKYACVEQSGMVSVLRYGEEQIRPGLAIVPPWDVVEPAAYVAPNRVPRAALFVCRLCGQRKEYAEDETLTVCPACGHNQWSDAVMEVEITRVQ